MAYPTVDAPYGLKPINLVGGVPFAGSTRMLPIQYDYRTDIFYGDFVKLVRGNVEHQAVTNDADDSGMVGIFLGCTYTDPTTKQKQFAQYYPSGTKAGDIMAYVSDDPNVVYKAVVCSTGTTVASGNHALVGQNQRMLNNTGSTTTGNSANAVHIGNTLTTAAFPVRIMGVVDETKKTTSVTGSSSSTTITCTALPNAIPHGTDVAYLDSAGQIIQTASFVSVAAAAGATSVTINSAIAVPGSVTAIPADSTILFREYPEVLVKLNFEIHSYQDATAV